MTQTNNKNSTGGIFVHNRFAALIAVTVCTWFLMPAQSAAGVIFSNLGTSPVFDLFNSNEIGNDFVGDNLAEADTFTPGATAQFGSLQLALSCFATCTDSFTVSLLADNLGTPGSAIENIIVPVTSLTATPTLVIVNSVSQPILTAGTAYWIAISSDPNDSIAWSNNATSDPSNQAISIDGGASWFELGNTPSAYEVDSTLTTTTPEPGTIALLAGGLILVMGRRLAKTDSSRSLPSN
jgi:hypothetical protein